MLIELIHPRIIQMDNNALLVYPTEQITYDFAYLKALISPGGERDAILISFIEQHFREESFKYEISLMLKYPYFANKILDDYESTNIEKRIKLLNKILFTGGGKIVLVDGARGGGKTGFGTWLFDEIHNRMPELKFYFVTKSEAKIPLPKWIKIVDNIDEVPNNSVALVDEGAIQLNARRAWTDENQDASDKLVVLRHKGITLIILVQNVKMVDINVRRLADVRVLKFGISFGVEENADETMDLKLIRARLRPKSKMEVYIEISSERIYMNFYHGLPEWWDDTKISKSLRNLKKLDRGKQRRDKYNQKKNLIQFESEQKQKTEIAILEKKKEIALAKIEKRKEFGMPIKKIKISELPQTNNSDIGAWKG